MVKQACLAIICVCTSWCVDMFSLRSNSKIKRRESVLAQASECRLLREPSLKDEEARSATAIAVSSQGVYISFFVDMLLRNSIYFSLHSKFDICSLRSHSICCLTANESRLRRTSCYFTRVAHWQRISSASAPYRVLYISSATRYAKHIERRVGGAISTLSSAELTTRSSSRENAPWG